MDSVTQIALGAAVGEAILGKRMGNKAPLWGAVLGVVPDLDFLASPFVNEVQALAIHRSFTHSILFCVLVAPIFGWIFSRYYKHKEVTWKRWSWMAFGVFTTHIFIDLCTSYGTQILHPFSTKPYSLNTIFIIDPFYTLPLLVGLALIIGKGGTSTFRRWANFAGLAVSSLYLLAGFGIKAHVHSVFEDNYEKANITPQQAMTTPAPLSIFLWTGYAVEKDTLYAGLYSIFDKDQQIKLHTMAQNKDIIASYKDQKPIERILWFSQGYYKVEEGSAGILLYDLRFGRSDLWIRNEPASYIRKYELEFNADSTEVTGFEEEFAGFDNQLNLLGNLANRAIGRK